jgi:hypothetical protein
MKTAYAMIVVEARTDLGDDQTTFAADRAGTVEDARAGMAFLEPYTRSAQRR